MDFRNRVKRFREAIPKEQFGEFQNAIIRELARELCLPFEVAADDPPSGYCYKTARQHQINFNLLIDPDIRN